ncbi:hypothetical protein KR038_000271 [Drosophila bunnanda]|nr:hypothetical protein KR038_000271 [Drosophila bunnanda]
MPCGEKKKKSSSSSSSEGRDFVVRLLRTHSRPRSRTRPRSPFPVPPLPLPPARCCCRSEEEAHENEIKRNSFTHMFLWPLLCCCLRTVFAIARSFILPSFMRSQF